MFRVLPSHAGVPLGFVTLLLLALVLLEMLLGDGYVLLFWLLCGRICDCFGGVVIFPKTPLRIMSA
jgi:hypothetical protein